MGAAVALALLVGFAVWLLLRSGGSSTSKTVVGTAAASVSPSQLKSLAASTGIPIFWASARTGYTYEYTRTSSNRVFVRYLPPGVAVGSNQAYLTIGTYPVQNAYAVAQTVSKRAGGIRVPLKGGLAFYNKRAPSHVYLAYRSLNYQIEVYDPSPGAARSLVASGRVAQVSGVRITSSGSASGAAHAVSRAGLKRLAASVKHPIYWVGAQPRTTYEVTQTAGARIFLRYLPKGVPVGSRSAYRTVGTYPVPNAYNVVSRLAKKTGSVRVKIKGRAIAFYNKSRPTSVYAAYPRSNVQIEVYDPSAGAARRLVTSGQLTAVG